MKTELSRDADARSARGSGSAGPILMSDDEEVTVTRNAPPGTEPVTLWNEAGTKAIACEPMYPIGARIAFKDFGLEIEPGGVGSDEYVERHGIILTRSIRQHGEGFYRVDVEGAVGTDAHGEFVVMASEVIGNLPATFEDVDSVRDWLDQ